MDNKKLSVVLEEFKQLLDAKYSGVTPDNYLSQVKMFLMFADNVPLRVNNEDILNYNLHLVKKKVSDSSRNVAINAIKAYFQLYLRKTVKEFSSIRPKKKKIIPRQIPHDILISKIKNTINTKARMILTLGYACGLRSSEVLDLKLCDIDIEEGFIIVFGKGSKERKLPIYQNTINLLISYVEEYNPITYLFNGRANNGDFKFQYSNGSILQLVKQNIGDYRYHDLRHSFAMKLYQNGTPLDKISKLLGHSNQKTTEIYAYATDNILLEIETPM
ncbi:MAG: tyrosine-type recombinase/integrase [Flavobacteriales bacterium]